MVRNRHEELKQIQKENEKWVNSSYKQKPPQDHIWHKMFPTVKRKKKR